MHRQSSITITGDSRLVAKPVEHAAAPLVPLPREFFARSATVVARQILGHYLVRRIPGGVAGGLIVETEAYLADDPASHGYKRETPRNRSMYGPPGLAYVYFIYGNHHCFNAVCRAPGVPEAVLVRAIEPVFGLEWMRARRPGINSSHLANGPGKLCAALEIGRDCDGVDLCQSGGAVFLACNPDLARTRRARGPVQVTPRIGISKAADLPLRFLLAGSGSVSCSIKARHG
jgi:DNA-3-methyladenine glycosylase